MVLPQAFAVLSSDEPKADEPLKVYVFDIKEQIAPPIWRTTQRAFAKAYEEKAKKQHGDD